MGNCQDFGGVDDSKFGDFTPLVGKYVALASVACTVCIGMDLFRSFRWKKPWIAVKYFPLNAATLTFLAIAIKIPSDISEKMPGLFDQLAKLSGIVLVSISMNHMMPSLGVMSDLTILSNTIALTILVITLFVNVLFQLQTKLITNFFFHNVMESVLMLFIFSIFISHAVTVTTVKKLLAKQYDSKHQQIQGEIDEQRYLTTNVFPVERLRDYVGRYWLLALTSSPDYALRSSGMALVSALVCWGLVGFGFITTVLTLVFKQWRDKTNGCYVRSKYKRSSGYVFGIQVVAIVAGTLASLLRGINYEPTNNFIKLRSLFEVEGYRIQKLEDWREAPLSFHVKNKRARKLAYKMMNAIVFCAILLQRLIIVLTKIVLYLLSRALVPVLYLLSRALVPVLYLLSRALVTFQLISDCFRGKKQKTDEENHREVSTKGGFNVDAMEVYVLHVEGIPSSKKETLEKWLDLITKWIEKGRVDEPKTLLSFLKDFSTPSQGFPGIQFYSDSVPSCWSLTLVNLAAVIRIAFKDSRPDDLSTLMKAVDEGFTFARFVDRTCPVEGSRDMITAAIKVWDWVNLYDKWMNEDLSKVVDRGDPLAIIDGLHGIAEKYMDGESTLKAIAAKCLHSITRKISTAHEPQTTLFSSLREALADTMGACLASLPRAILMYCSSGTFGAREEKVKKATLILGKAQCILQWLVDERTVN